MKYLLFIYLIILSFGALANDTPIEVTADNALEWNRAAKHFTATGNAVISQGQNKINAPSIIADYTEVDGDIVIQSITAKTNAKLTQNNDTLTAETITADFQDGVLDTVRADNNVILKTDKETLTGDKANYNAIDRTIIVTGDVTILQGENILKGDRAEFDLNTNISRLSASPQTNGGRVHAVFKGQ